MRLFWGKINIWVTMQKYMHSNTSRNFPKERKTHAEIIAEKSSRNKEKLKYLRRKVTSIRNLANVEDVSSQNTLNYTENDNERAVKNPWHKHLPCRSFLMSNVF